MIYYEMTSNVKNSSPNDSRLLKSNTITIKIIKIFLCRQNNFMLVDGIYIFFLLAEKKIIYILLHKSEYINDQLKIKNLEVADIRVV